MCRAVTTERTIQRRELKWSQRFSSSMMRSIAGMSLDRFYTPIAISLFGG
jgi:hypothetical protein